MVSLFLGFFIYMRVGMNSTSMILHVVCSYWLLEGCFVKFSITCVVYKTSYAMLVSHRVHDLDCYVEL